MVSLPVPDTLTALFTRCGCTKNMYESSQCCCQTNGLAFTELCICTECKNMPADNLQFETPDCGLDGDEMDSDGVEDDISEDELM